MKEIHNGQQIIDRVFETIQRVFSINILITKLYKFLDLTRKLLVLFFVLFDRIFECYFQLLVLFGKFIVLFSQRFELAVFYAQFLEGFLLFLYFYGQLEDFAFIR